MVVSVRCVGARSFSSLLVFLVFLVFFSFFLRSHLLFGDEGLNCRAGQGGSNFRGRGGKNREDRVQGALPHPGLHAVELQRSFYVEVDWG